MRKTSSLTTRTLTVLSTLLLLFGFSITQVSADEGLLAQFESDLQQRFALLSRSVVDIVVDVSGEDVFGHEGLRPSLGIPQPGLGGKPEPPTISDVTAMGGVDCLQKSSLRFFGPDRMGTGIVIDEHRHILTAESLLRNLDSVPEYTIWIHADSVTSEISMKAEIVGSDPFTGIVILKPIPKTPLEEAVAQQLQPVELARGYEAKPGSIVIMISNAYGMKHSCFWGILSGRQKHLDCWLMHDYLQSTLPLHPGAVGAPVCDRNGHVVGIMAASFRKAPWQEVSFAIPTSRFLSAIPILIEQGCVPRGYLGVGISDSAEKRSQYGIPEGISGVLVTQVLENSPAANAGIAPGDVIQEVLSTRIFSVPEVLWTIANSVPESVAEIVVWRAGEFRNFNLVLGNSCEETAWNVPR